MTRKRVGSGLIEVFSDNCEHCNGRGIIVSAEPIDRPAGDGSDAASSSGGNRGGGGDTGNGRGTRGRRSRGTGRDTEVVVVVEPKVVPGGPTPSQIAAAAHAAALHAVAHDETAAPSASEDTGDTQVTSPEVPLQSAVAVRSRRRSPRSAKSPVVSLAVASEPMTLPPQIPLPPVSAPEVVAVVAADNVEADSVEADKVADLAEVAQVPGVSAPAARGRRKRARVISPAGPPPGAGGGDGPR
jgi:ribonuclease E